MTTAVLIADDHPIYRRGLREIIEETGRFIVVAEANTGVEAIQAIRRCHPAVAVLDIAMPEADGLQVLEQSRGWPEKPAVILLTMYDDYVETAMRLGASGYLLKENAEDELVACLDTVARGGRFVSKGLHWDTKKGDVSGPALQLTPTERRILRLIAELKTSREIGELLSVSHRTVQNHRANMCHKLELQGDKALLGFALKNKPSLTD